MDDKELLAERMYRKLFNTDEFYSIESTLSQLHSLLILENVNLNISISNMTNRLITLLNLENLYTLKSTDSVNKTIDLIAKYISTDTVRSLANSLLLNTNTESISYGLQVIERIKDFQGKKNYIEVINLTRHELAFLTGIRNSYNDTILADKALQLLMELDADVALDSLTLMIQRHNYDYKKILGWIIALNDLVSTYQSDYFLRKENIFALKSLKELREELISLYNYLYPSLTNQYYNNAEPLFSLKYIDARQFINEVESEIKKDSESTIKYCGSYMIMVKVREGIYKIDEILDLSEKFKKFRLLTKQKTYNNLNEKKLQRKNNL